ncbi:helix-turn-helix transcriptional regulator [Nocardia wallacei]|uniref:helix-turn-helix transcriptional regulator n=1 Tax=Nocardia wallacei TaxID=480035 RepID=UPI001E55B04B|nr:WYL domain-containing protein [Nocardia wallacei]
MAGRSAGRAAARQRTHGAPRYRPPARTGLSGAGGQRAGRWLSAGSGQRTPTAAVRRRAGGRARRGIADRGRDGSGNRGGRRASLGDRASGAANPPAPARRCPRVHRGQIDRNSRRFPADTDTLLALGAAIRSGEELRFDYASPARPQTTEPRPPRRVQPHHLVARGGYWYLVGWDPQRADWRIYRADRMTLRIPNGPRFSPRPVPDGDVAAFLSARFKGSHSTDIWPCNGEAILKLSAAQVLPFAGDGVVEPYGPDRTRLLLGSWSWAALAATLARFDTEIEAVAPQQLRDAFATLSRRAARAAGQC